MGFFHHDDEDERKAYEQVQAAERDGNEAHLSEFPLALHPQWPPWGSIRSTGLGDARSPRVPEPCTF